MHIMHNFRHLLAVFYVTFTPFNNCYSVQKNKATKKKPAQHKEEIKPEDDGYDGYYDDVLPPDIDRTREGIDKELVKKIVILGVSVLLIISLCVVMMYML